MLLNLAGNAIKFTERGGVALIVEPGDARRTRSRSLVRDTGIGIAPEEQARIFLEFEQADGGATRRFGGTGLGLAISRRIIERMGGRIAVDSTPGAGSTFRVTVPLPRRKPTRDAPFAPPDLTGMRCPDRRTARDRSLAGGAAAARWGARTCLVPDETVALALLPERPWDAVVVDRALGARRQARAGARRPARCAPHRAGHTRRAARACRAEGGGLHRLSGQAVARGLARRAALRRADAFESTTGQVPTTQPELAPDATRGLAILVAEDNDINALLARALLGRLGHRPTIATSGAAAVEAWRGRAPAARPTTWC